MAGLIKSAEANGVRAFTPSLPVPSQSREVPEPDPALARLEAEVVRLQALMQT